MQFEVSLELDLLPIKGFPPDLLILDMIMDPGIDGLVTYRRFLELHPGQKAIIVRGLSEMKRVRKSVDLGAGAFVKKPYALEKIGQMFRLELNKDSLSSAIISALHPMDWTECVRVTDRSLGPRKGQKGSCHEKTKVIQSRVQASGH